MSSARGRIASEVRAALLLGAWLCGSVAGCLLLAGSIDAQPLFPVSETREIYSYAALSSTQQQEYQRTPEAPFAAFVDSVWSYLDALYKRAESQAHQNSKIFQDSIYIYERASKERINAFAATAKSDASIIFRIDAAPSYGIRYGMEVYAEVGKSGAYAPAYVTLLLSGPGPGGRTQVSFQIQAGPGGPPVNRSRSFYHPGILPAGEYTLEAHCSAAEGEGASGAEIFVVFKLYETVPVTPTTWSEVKSLYRGE